MSVAVRVVSGVEGRGQVDGEVGAACKKTIVQQSKNRLMFIVFNRSFCMFYLDTD